MHPPKKSKELKAEPVLRIVPGGRDGDGNWLIGLNEGCVFLTRELGSDKTFLLLQFHIMKKWKRAVWLHRNFPHANEDIFVDSLVFSNTFELIEIQEDGSPDNKDTLPRTVEDNVIDISEHKIL